MKKNRYEIKYYSLLEGICIIPWVLGFFPVPFGMPIVFVWAAIQKPESFLPIAIIYFTWLIIGGAVIYYFEKKYP